MVSLNFTLWSSSSLLVRVICCFISCKVLLKDSWDIFRSLIFCFFLSTLASHFVYSWSIAYLNSWPYSLHLSIISFLSFSRLTILSLRTVTSLLKLFSSLFWAIVFSESVPLTSDKALSHLESSPSFWASFRSNSDCYFYSWNSNSLYLFSN